MLIRLNLLKHKRHKIITSTYKIFLGRFCSDFIMLSNKCEFKKYFIFCLVCSIQSSYKELFNSIMSLNILNIPRNQNHNSKLTNKPIIQFPAVIFRISTESIYSIVGYDNPPAAISNTLP